jgi:hypothetical protein
MITTDHFQNNNGAGLIAFQDFPAELHVDNPEKPLAKGVLRQAAKDLRLFQAAQDRVGRALFMDAYTWVLSDDVSWPYSFVNVCQLLGLPIERTRNDLILDAQCGWYRRSVQTVKRISASIRDGLGTSFGRRTVSKGPAAAASSANASTTVAVLPT